MDFTYIDTEEELNKEAETWQKAKELAMAKKMQAELLPAFLPETDKFSIAGFSEPSRAIGGDLYDVFKIDDENTAILIYDVCGHGVPAALISAMTKIIFEKSFNSSISLAEQLNRMNRELCDDSDSYDFVAVFLGILNHRARTLKFIGAGFPPPRWRSRMLG